MQLSVFPVTLSPACRFEDCHTLSPPRQLISRMLLLHLVAVRHCPHSLSPIPFSLSLSIVLPTSRSLSLPDCVTHMMPSLLVNTLCPYLTLSLHSLSRSLWSGRAGSPAQF
ncbi:hypothetical protein QQF64_015103 [Cirrhinus molitorella]|uniref:Uncharacterized protein n=1 Tax=Cirrhinus molitorella TaxID=172907 RepID=A0ABR3NTZ7_9TELE